jgi:putative serine protease PepD
MAAEPTPGIRHGYAVASVTSTDADNRLVALEASGISMAPRESTESRCRAPLGTPCRMRTRPSGRRSSPLVGSYAPDDLAVVDIGRGHGISAARFADSSKLAVGEVVLAEGNPLGLQSSVTEGIVSALGRNVSEGQGVVLPSAIQTSAPINPGNSGGALIDLEGRVVGIPT